MYFLLYQPNYYCMQILPKEKIYSTSFGNLVHKSLTYLPIFVLISLIISQFENDKVYQKIIVFPEPYVSFFKREIRWWHTMKFNPCIPIHGISGIN